MDNDATLAVTTRGLDPNDPRAVGCPHRIARTR